MKKTIKISEEQLKTAIKQTIKEVEYNSISSIGDEIIKSILNGGILYDTNCPYVFEKENTLAVNTNKYSVYIIGNTDSKPYLRANNKYDYNNQEIIWEPTTFTLKYIFGIGDINLTNEFDEEYTSAISDYVINKLPKIQVDNGRYDFVINSNKIDDDDYMYDYSEKY